MYSNSEAGRLIAEEDYEGAPSILDGAISKSPGTSSLYKTRSQVHRYMGKDDGADEDLRQYISLISQGRTGIMGRLRCRFGNHSEVSQYERPDHCIQTAICERCSKRKRRIGSHGPLGEWKFRTDNPCVEIRQCLRCGMTARNRTRPHQWVRAGSFSWRCDRCGAKKDDDPPGW